MKKAFILLFCLIIQLTANAQLKVHSNGHVTICNTDPIPLSLLSLGNNSDSTYYMTCKGNKQGLLVRSSSTGSTFSNYAGNYISESTYSLLTCGIRGVGERTTSAIGLTPKVVGVQGYSFTNDTVAMVGYGVHGIIWGKTGAAICGQTDYHWTPTLNKKYAGLFYGETMVDGNLVVSGIIKNPLLLRSVPENIEMNRIDNNDDDSVNDKMAKLTVVEYYDQQPSTNSKEMESLMRAELDDIPNKEHYLNNTSSKTETNVLTAQMLHNKHYALTVDQLEDVFPNLVYTDDDGTKAINYMEMIPLLVQSINELQAQINVLTAKEEVKKAPAVSAVGADPMLACTATLYQNTPNPFNERTEIRFSLPDDTQNANICIFDMSGKMLKQIPVTSSMQSITINGYELAAGMYLYSLVVGGQEIDTKRMILSK